MERVILVRYTEIHLKGLNRPFFEQKLIENIRISLRGVGCKVEREQGRIYVVGIAEEQFDEAIERLKHVFGVYSISPALAVDKDWQCVCDTAFSLMEKQVEKDPGLSFKVFARRSDKNYFMNSDQINRELGHEVLERFPSVHVDIHKPKVSLCVEIREKAYVYAEEIPCAKGMPVGTAGRAMLLISGGIDSPVAGYMMAKRGLFLSAVHFYSYPYTSERARDKVVELARLVSAYSGPIRLHLVPFTDIQMTIYDRCPEKETTVIMRRLMMEIAERIAVSDGAKALITGEALGQVASQTLESLCVTDDAVSMPVFRPLIGFDKDDIMDYARRIGTYETSILPYEDCCTVFVPKHPVTRPVVEDIRASEAAVDFSELIEKAIDSTEHIVVHPGDAKLI
ncbi:MAG: tRNA 4-thiouridine(8) synthase ThiI [Clostridia bacterium]|nr:tRNA 4-thiouridine(8) synthase ThiI [Clostridia bacterium]